MAFKDFVAELFEPFGGVTLRPMFGGTALMREGRMFAFTLSDVLYFKTDETSAARYRAEGAKQFVYAGMKGREVAMPYWEVPLRLLDEQDELLEWAKEAFEVSQRTGKAKAAPKANAPKARRAKKPATPVAKKPAAKRPAAKRR
jgi:DNA transformation protein